ncbi:hypothetical protein IscW_ISCW006850, partial [Ixodes scapularis]
RFGTKCAGCAMGISPTDLVRRARSKVFHLKCFTCLVCRKQLSTGEELYVLDEHRFVCKDDYLARQQPPPPPDARPYAATGRIPSRSYVARVDLCNPREGPPHGVPPSSVRAARAGRGVCLTAVGPPAATGDRLTGPLTRRDPGDLGAGGPAGGSRMVGPHSKRSHSCAAAASATEDRWPAMGAEGGHSSSAPSTACVERQYGWAR